VKNVITFLLLLIGCKTESTNKNTTKDIALNNHPIKVENTEPTEEPYTIKFLLETTAKNETFLVIEMELNNDSHFVSPNAKRDFKGKFNPSLKDNEFFTIEGELIESPLSVEEIDPHPFVGGAVNWVRVNTTYRQKISINTQEDFDYVKTVQFTIEPRCTLEKVEYIVKSRSGKVYFERFLC
jgi:hypothetical protein